MRRYPVVHPAARPPRSAVRTRSSAPGPAGSSAPAAALGTGPVPLPPPLPSPAAGPPPLEDTTGLEKVDRDQAREEGGGGFGGVRREVGIGRVWVSSSVHTVRGVGVVVGRYSI